MEKYIGYDFKVLNELSDEKIFIKEVIHTDLRWLI